ncbi:SwmB domain-containing protein [Leptothrix sp. BB-4]
MSAKNDRPSIATEKLQAGKRAKTRHADDMSVDLPDANRVDLDAHADPAVVTNEGVSDPGSSEPGLLALLDTGAAGAPSSGAVARADAPVADTAAASSSGLGGYSLGTLAAAAAAGAGLLLVGGLAGGGKTGSTSSGGGNTGGNTGGGTDGGTTNAKLSFSGVVAMGLSSAGLLITAYDRNGNAIDTALTDDQGHFALHNIAATLAGQAITLVAVDADPTDGIGYVDEATGESRDLVGELRTTMIVGTAVQQTAAITPLTELATRHIVNGANGHTVDAQQASVVSSLNRAIGQLFGVSDIVGGTPKVVTRTSTTADTDSYGHALALLSGMDESQSRNGADNPMDATLRTLQSGMTVTIQGEVAAQFNGLDTAALALLSQAAAGLADRIDPTLLDAIRNTAFNAAKSAFGTGDPNGQAVFISASRTALSRGADATLSFQFETAPDATQLATLKTDVAAALRGAVSPVDADWSGSGTTWRLALKDDPDLNLPVTLALPSDRYMANELRIAVDSTAPLAKGLQVIGLTGNPAVKTTVLKAGDTLRWTLVLDEPGVVQGVPELSFIAGTAPTRKALYVASASSSQHLVFDYQVGPDDNAELGSVNVNQRLQVNDLRFPPDAAITDLAGNPFTSLGNHVNLDTLNNMAADGLTSLRLDTTAPTFDASTQVPLSGATIGKALADHLTLHFSEPVKAGSSGSFVVWQIVDGRATEVARIAATAVAFGADGQSVTVALGKTLAPGHYQVTIDAGAITDRAGNAHAGLSRDSTGAWTFDVGSVDLGIHAVTQDNILNASELAAASAAHKLVVSGTITGDATLLAGLNDNDLHVSLRPLAQAAGATLLSTVTHIDKAAGTWTAELDINAGATADAAQLLQVSIDTTSVKSSAARVWTVDTAAQISLSPISGDDRISALERQIIDSGRDLAISYRTEVGASGSLVFYPDSGDTRKTVTKTFTKASGGIETVKLTAADLLTMGSGPFTVRGTLTDAAGNVLHDSPLRSFELAPRAGEVSATTLASVQLVNVPTSGGYQVGDRIEIDATFSAAVTVQGIGLQAQLLMGTGSAALARSASLVGTSDDRRVLHFAYVVRAGDTDADGIAVPADALRLAGSRIVDAAGLSPTLSHPAVAARAAAFVDTTASLPDLQVTAASGIRGGIVALAITAALTDTDGSETLSSVSLSGAPDGSVLRSGTTVFTATGGVFSVPADQLAGLTLTPPATYSGSFTLKASVTATETVGGHKAARNADLPVTVTAGSGSGDTTPPTASTTELTETLDRGVLTSASADTLRLRFSESVRVEDIRAAIANGTIVLKGSDGSTHSLGSGWTLDAYTPSQITLKGFGSDRVNGAFTSLWDSSLNGGKGGNTRVPTFSSDYALGLKSAFNVDATSTIYTHTDASGGVWYLWRQAGWNNYLLSKAESSPGEWYIGSLSSVSNPNAREVVLGVSSWFARSSTVPEGTDPWASATQLDEAVASSTSGALGRTYLLGLGSGNTAASGDVLTLASGSVHDAAGNANPAPITFTLPADITRPTSPGTQVAGYAADGITPKSGPLAIGDHVRVTLHYAEPVRVSTNATPGVGIVLANGSREALLDRSKSFTSAQAADGYTYSSDLVFVYKVQAGDFVGAGGITLASFNRHNTNTFDAAGNRYTPPGDLPDAVNSIAIATDNTEPYVWASYASGSIVTLTASEDLDASHPPPLAAFSVRVNDVAVNVSAVVVGTGNLSRHVTLTLATPVTSGQLVKVNYQDPTNGSNDLHALQDLAGNDVSPNGGFQAQITATSAPSVRFVAYNAGELEVADGFGTRGSGTASAEPSELWFHVEYDNAVQVSGTPQLALTLTDDQGVPHAVQARYRPSSNASTWGQTSLSFVYTLQPGDRGSVHLDSASIDLNGGQISAAGSGGASTANLVLPPAALPFTQQTWVYGGSTSAVGSAANDLLAPWIHDPTATPLTLANLAVQGGDGNRDTLLLSIALPASVDTQAAAAGWHLAYTLAADNSTRQVQLLDAANQLQRTYTVPTDAAWPGGIEQLAYHLLYRDTRGQWQFTGNGDPLLLARGVTESVDAAGQDVFVQGSLGADTIDLSSHATGQRILVRAGPGRDTITGHAGVDIVAGQGGANTINTGAGDDVVIVGRGQDTIDGGTGTDTLRLTLPGSDSRIVDIGASFVIRSTLSGNGSGSSSSSSDTTTWVDRYRLDPATTGGHDGRWQVTDLALNQVVALVSNVEQIQLRHEDNTSRRINLQVVVGSDGSDTLTAGELTLSGQGDDQITVNAGTLRLSDWQTPLQIDGGAGTDRLVLGSNVSGASGRLDGLLQNTTAMAINPSRGVRRIEGIDLTGGGQNTLLLDVAQILALHDSGDDSGKNLWVSATAGSPAVTNFAVAGNSGSTLKLTDSGWTNEGAQATLGGKVVYANKAANTVLVVDPAVMVTLPTGAFSYGISSQTLNGQVTEGTGNSGTTVTFTVSRSGDTGLSSSVYWTTMTAGGLGASDFVGDVLPTGTVSFAAGETSKTLTVQIKADSLPESGESFGIALQTADAVKPNTWVSVMDDDSGGGGSGVAPSAAPTVSAITLQASTAVFPGKQLALDLTFDQQVVISGVPTLNLIAQDANGGTHPLVARYDRQGLSTGQSQSVARFVFSYTETDVIGLGGQLRLATDPLRLPTDSSASIVGASHPIVASLGLGNAIPAALSSVWMYAQAPVAGTTGTSHNDVLEPWKLDPSAAPKTLTALQAVALDGGAGLRDGLVLPIVLDGVTDAATASGHWLDFDPANLKLHVLNASGVLVKDIDVPNPVAGNTAWPLNIEALAYQLTYRDATANQWLQVEGDRAMQVLWRSHTVLTDPVTGDQSWSGAMTGDQRDASAVPASAVVTFDSSPGGDTLIGHAGRDIVMPQQGTAHISTGAGDDVVHLAGGPQHGSVVQMGSGDHDTLLLRMDGDMTNYPVLEADGSVTLKSAHGSWVNGSFAPDAAGLVAQFNLKAVDTTSDVQLEIRHGNGSHGDAATTVAGVERIGLVHGGTPGDLFEIALGSDLSEDMTLPGHARGVLAGGGGDDTLHIQAGGTIALGGAGHDRLELSTSSFGNGWLILDGGKGRDLLALGSDVQGHTSTLDKAPGAPSVARSIEGYDLTGGGNNTLELGGAGILSLHDDTDGWNVWSPLKDNAGTSDADRLQFLVVGDNGDTLRLLTGSAGSWTEAAPIMDPTYGELRVWNGADTNGQLYQVLVAASVTTSLQPATPPAVL